MSRLINRTTSPTFMWGFLLGLAFLTVYACTYGLLTEPLFRYFSIPGQPFTSSVLHVLLIALTGSAVCCLAFFLPDRRVPLLAFGWLAFLLALLYALAAIFFAGEARMNLFALISAFGLAPALLGNGMAWGVYRFMLCNREGKG